MDRELIPLDVAQGVNHLKNVQKANKVILYGNSGGGVTMSFYQAVVGTGLQSAKAPISLPSAEIISPGEKPGPIESSARSIRSQKWL